MRNRHTFLLFLVIVMTIMLFTNGCAKSSNQDNEKITDKVIELEKDYYLLHSAQMSYTEYLSNVEPIIFSNSSYLDMYEKEDIFRNIDKEWKLFEMRSTIVAGYDNPKGGHIVTPQDETNLFKEYNNEKVVYDTTINLEQYDVK